MENMQINWPRYIVKCPHCNYEYLLGEILYPNNIVGQPKNIIRDPLGKILYEEYREDEEPVAEEHFTCYHCNKPFIIDVNVQGKTRPEVEELDFSELSTSLF